MNSSFVVSILLGVTLVTASSLTAIRLARRSRAATRHVWLAATFVTLLLWPTVALIAPRRELAVPTFAGTRVVAPAVDLISTAISTRPSVSTLPTGPGARRTFQTPSWSAVLFVGWLVGAGLCCAPVVIALCQVRPLRQSGIPWRHGEAVVRKLAADIRLRSKVDVLLQERVASPMTCGTVHPTIVLPVDATHWPADALERSLVHELEHIRRHDWAIHCLSRTISAAYWFHPFVWMAQRRLTLEAERACDDAVVLRAEAEGYADQLVDLARRLSTARHTPLLGMASRRDLDARIRALLDSRQARGRAGALVVLFAGLISAGLVLTMSPLRIVATAQTASSSSPQGTRGDWEKAAGGPMKFDVASVRENTEPMSANSVHFNVPITTWDFPVGVPTGGLFSATNLPVDVYLGFAYKLQGYALDAFERQLPKWAAGLGGRRYDIEARAAGDPTRDQYRLMMQSLLADRFKLAVHWETKEMPVMALVLNKPGKLGSRLRVHLDDPPCPDSSEVVLPQILPAITGGFPLDCGVVAKDRKDVTPGNARYFARNVSMATLAVTLTYSSREVGKPVIDRTGLTGNYDFVFEYTPDNPSQTRPDEIRLTDALKDDLGLKLEPAIAPVNVLILDHIEEPSPGRRQIK